jgi:hypothetical protein
MSISPDSIGATTNAPSMKIFMRMLRPILEIAELVCQKDYRLIDERRKPDVQHLCCLRPRATVAREEAQSSCETHGSCAGCAQKLLGKCVS